MTLSCRTVAAALAGILIGACAADQTIAPADPAFHTDGAEAAARVTVCHRPGDPKVIEVSARSLGAHLAHGDYLTSLFVTHDLPPSDDGIHFRRIGDAIDAARAGRLSRGETQSAACRITIRVAEGTYSGTAGVPASDLVDHFPLVVDVPELTIRGALDMALDANHRATGTGRSSAGSVLSPIEPLPVGAASTPIIIANAHPDGSAGHGLTITGFVFRSGHDPAVDAGGQGVFAIRVQGLRIRGNRFDAGFTESIDLREVSGSVSHNYLQGTAGTCDVCLGGPGRLEATGNTLLAGGIPGIVVTAPFVLPVPPEVEQVTPTATSETWIAIRNNAIQDHLRVPVGSGIRIDGIGRGESNTAHTIHATIRNNLLVNNRFGIIVHAAFPTAGTLLRSDIDVALGGNDILGSCQAKLLVSFSRHTTPMGLTSNPYLKNSTFDFRLNGDLDWAEAWYGHPDGNGNTLIVDGVPITPGVHHAYDPVGCPGA